jgi:hypothetical protein
MDITPLTADLLEEDEGWEAWFIFWEFYDKDVGPSRISAVLWFFSKFEFEDYVNSCL